MYQVSGKLKSGRVFSGRSTALDPFSAITEARERAGFEADDPPVEIRARRLDKSAFSISAEPPKPRVRTPAETPATPAIPGPPSQPQTSAQTRPASQGGTSQGNRVATSGKR